MSSRKSKAFLRSVVSSVRQSLNSLHLLWDQRTADLNSKRIFILDPALRDDLGHHLDQAKSLLAEAADMGLPCVILGNREADRTALGIPVRSYFRISGYSTAKRNNEDDVHTLKQNRILLEDLSRLPASIFCSDDLVIFPAVVRNQILGICQWIARIGHRDSSAPRFAICLMAAPDWLKSSQVGDAAAVYRQAVACLRLSSRVVWTCETAELADVFEPILGCRPVVLPVVILPDLEGLAPTNGEGRSFPSDPMVSILGYTKPEKGSLIVPEIIEQVGRMRRGVRFTVQAANQNAQQENALARACEGVLPAPRVIRGSVDQQSFVRLLKETDLMLLPYDAKSYGPRGSGLANQATTLSIPMVAPAGCSFGDAAAAEGRAVLFAIHDPGSVATAVVAALDRLGDLKRNAAVSASLAAERPTYLATLMDTTAQGGFTASQDPT